MPVVMAVRKTLAEGDQIVLLHSLIHQQFGHSEVSPSNTLQNLVPDCSRIRGLSAAHSKKKRGSVCFSDGGIAIYTFPRSPITATFSLHE